MIIMEIEANMNAISLYDYVIKGFEKYFDLTEGRLLSLNYFLNNCNAHFVSLSDFKNVYGIDSLADILKLITNEDYFDELREFGILFGKNNNEELFNCSLSK